VWEATYLPYGQEWNPPSGSGPVSPNHYKFTGKERDAESGLDYFGARYYSSGLGRFQSEDPREIVFERGSIKFLEYLADPQNWNRYAYALNNPLGITDFDGREPNKSQSGTWQQIVAIVQQIEQANPGASPRHILSKVDQYFRNRADSPGATRFVYTKGNGWIDFKHFFAAANSAVDRGEFVTNVGGLYVETVQLWENRSMSQI